MLVLVAKLFFHHQRLVNWLTFIYSTIIIGAGVGPSTLGGSGSISIVKA
jgi:hypothetical protein